MKELRLVILGATGLVGRELLKLLERGNLPIASLTLLGGSKSEGLKIKFKDDYIKVREADKNSFKDADIIFGCADKFTTSSLLPYIKASGAYFIDNSSLLRLDKDVPLIVPEINIHSVNKDTKVISNPNCSTIIVSLAVLPVLKLYGLNSLEASTYQAVSGAGKKAVEEFNFEIGNYFKKEEFKPEALSETIMCNVIPFIGKSLPCGYTDEEMKMQNEMRKIFTRKDLKVSCTSVRVPVMRCHSFSLTLNLDTEPDLDEVNKAYFDAPYIRNYCGNYFPSPLKCEGSFKVAVGRLRKNLIDKKSLSLFCTSDQLILGSAGNALKTAEHIYEFL